jgi:hypothetical protein
MESRPEVGAIPHASGIADRAGDQRQQLTSYVAWPTERLCGSRTRGRYLGRSGRAERERQGRLIVRA